MNAERAVLTHMFEDTYARYENRQSEILNVVCPELFLRLSNIGYTDEGHWILCGIHTAVVSHKRNR